MQRRKSPIPWSGLFPLLLTLAGLTAPHRLSSSPEETPAWWQIILHLEAQGDYQLEAGETASNGHYSFAVRWRGILERDDDDYLLYALDNDLKEWNATETTVARGILTQSTTTDFKERPILIFNYILRKDEQLHLDFMVNGIVVPQTESEDHCLLLFPSSAENNQSGEQTRYNHHITKGSNRIALQEKEIYAGRVDRTFIWDWKNRSSTLKANRTLSTTHAHTAILKLSVVPRYSRSEGTSLSPRMVPFVDLAEPLPADVGVNLGCGDLAVSEHHLDRAKVRPSFEKMGGERMP